MTRISRIKVDPKHLSFFINNFWNLITLLENKDQVKNFLKDLLTHTEMKMLAKRIQIAKMLLEGNSYRDIKSYVKVTDSTIARVNNILEAGGEGLKAAINYLWKIEKEIDRKRMGVVPDFKTKYPSHFLVERILDSVSKKIRMKRKRLSVKQSTVL